MEIDVKQSAGLLLILPLLLLLDASCSGVPLDLPSKRQIVELTWKDGTKIICLEPPPDVLATGIKANAEVAAQKIGTILKGTGGVGVDIERIRQELPSDISAFDLVEFKICVQYGNQVLSKEEYRAFTRQILPAIKMIYPQKTFFDANVDNDLKVYFECGFAEVPKTIPPGGMRMMGFSSLTPDTRAYPEVTRWGSPPMPNPWAQPARSYSGTHYMCEVTNYGNEPIFRVRLSFDADFYDGAEKPKLSTIRLSIIHRIEGPNGRFQFYLINDSEYALVVYLPESADLRRFGDTENRTVKLVTPIDGKMAVPLGPLLINKRRE